MEAIEHGTETNKNVVKQKNKTKTKQAWLISREEKCLMISAFFRWTLITFQNMPQYEWEFILRISVDRVGIVSTA